MKVLFYTKDRDLKAVADELEGHEVHTVTSMAEAEDAAGEDSCAIILDFDLDAKEGEKILKEWGEYEGILRLIVSSKLKTRDFKKFQKMDSPPDGAFLKPVEAADFKDYFEGVEIAHKNMGATSTGDATTTRSSAEINFLANEEEREGTEEVDNLSFGDEDVEEGDLDISDEDFGDAVDVTGVTNELTLTGTASIEDDLDNLTATSTSSSILDEDKAPPATAIPDELNDDGGDESLMFDVDDAMGEGSDDEEPASLDIDMADAMEFDDESAHDAALASIGEEPAYASELNDKIQEKFDVVSPRSEGGFMDDYDKVEEEKPEEIEPIEMDGLDFGGDGESQEDNVLDFPSPSNDENDIPEEPDLLDIGAEEPVEMAAGDEGLDFNLMEDNSETAAGELDLNNEETSQQPNEANMSNEEENEDGLNFDLDLGDDGAEETATESAAADDGGLDLSDDGGLDFDMGGDDGLDLDDSAGGGMADGVEMEGGLELGDDSELGLELDGAGAESAPVAASDDGGLELSLDGDDDDFELEGSSGAAAGGSEETETVADSDDGGMDLDLDGDEATATSTADTDAGEISFGAEEEDEDDLAGDGLDLDDEPTGDIDMDAVAEVAAADDEDEIGGQEFDYKTGMIEAGAIKAEEPDDLMMDDEETGDIDDDLISAAVEDDEDGGMDDDDLFGVGGDDDDLMEAPSAPSAPAASAHVIGGSIPPARLEEDEAARLQATIRQLREEREDLLREIESLKDQKRELQQENLGMKAELDDLRIEISIVKKRHDKELDDARLHQRIAEEKMSVSEEKARHYQREYEKLGEKVRVDINKIKKREKELESQLELQSMDSEAQVRSRDGKILDLKRKIDSLEFNMENAAIREQKSKDDKRQLEDRLSQIMKTLRGSIKVLEEGLDIDEEVKEKLKKL